MGTEQEMFFGSLGFKFTLFEKILPCFPSSSSCSYLHLGTDEILMSPFYRTKQFQDITFD